LAKGGGDRLDVRQAATGTVIARETRVQVEADVHATVVRVAGTVTGNVTGGELVELLASAVVKGDVAAPALHVVEGARLEGRVQMLLEKPGKPSTG
jgi:cytoskeletal protein CcmA (bactofilin family)